MQVGGGIDIGRAREQSGLSNQEIAGGEETEGTKTFGQFLKELAQDANSSGLQANAKMQDVAAGRNKDLHGAVLAMEKADVQFRLLTQVRNKVIDAYREIMRMQV